MISGYCFNGAVSFTEVQSLLAARVMVDTPVS